MLHSGQDTDVWAEGTEGPSPAPSALPGPMDHVQGADKTMSMQGGCRKQPGGRRDVCQRESGNMPPLGQSHHVPVELLFVLDLTTDRLGSEPVGIVPDPDTIERLRVTRAWR